MVERFVRLFVAEKQSIGEESEEAMLVSQEEPGVAGWVCVSSQ